ncbi:MAG TPA: DAK2 domain-containing protein, partial [Pseudonocardiaceae bacterium]
MTAVLEELGPAAVARWVQVSLDVLTAHREELDRLNVFPVPDADTGRNLLDTLYAAAGTGETLGALARGATLGARGNSGMVLSQLLRGLAESSGRHATADARWLCDGLDLGAGYARAAFAVPVDGTALSVLAAAAAGAAAA